MMIMNNNTTTTQTCVSRGGTFSNQEVKEMVKAISGSVKREMASQLDSLSIKLGEKNNTKLK